MTQEHPEFPRGTQPLSAFFENLDDHLDLGPFLVEIYNKFVSSRFYLCKTRSEFENAVRDLGKHDEIRISECSEIEPHCTLLRE